ncbi:hypothetical protein B0H10DRAFT_1940000 [Mycena sp. CBHHK59/15]|nr:hypothetical protein B0H10DRAFT_1940000 [Mycena sp. CBHHK59/15]
MPKKARDGGWGKWLNSEPAILLDRESLSSPNGSPRERPANGGGELSDDTESTPEKGALTPCILNSMCAYIVGPRAAVAGDGEGDKHRVWETGALSVVEECRAGPEGFWEQEKMCEGETREEWVKGEVRSGANENVSSPSSDIGLAHLDITEHGLISDAGDTSLCEIDERVKTSTIGDGKLPTTHKHPPGKGEHCCEHPTVMIIRELCEDVCENLAGDSTAGFAGRSPVAPLYCSNESLEKGTVESLNRPSMLCVDGSEAREIPRESGQLHRGGFVAMKSCTAGPSAGSMLLSA